MISLIVAAALLAGSQSATQPYTPNGPKIVVTMNYGKSFEITTDPKASPKTVAHILDLCNRKFYDRQRIHRVESWVTQWGSPASKTEDLKSDAVLSGVSGKQLPFEESQIDFLEGVVGVASTGLQVGGDSQLFILKRDTERLWRSYAVVGKVTKGMDVVRGIQWGDRIATMRVIK